MLTYYTHHRRLRNPFINTSFLHAPPLLYVPLTVTGDRYSYQPSFGQRVYNILMSAGSFVVALFLFMFLGRVAFVFMIGLGLAMLLSSLVDFGIAAAQGAKSFIFPSKVERHPKDPSNSKGNSSANQAARQQQTGIEANISDTTHAKGEATGTKDKTDENVKPSSEKATVYKRATTRVEENSEERLILSFDLPGVASNHVFVNVVPNKDRSHLADLKIRAERLSADGNNRVRYHQHFHLQRQRFHINQIHTRLMDGVLTVSIPKQELAKPISVPIVQDHPNKSDSLSSFCLDVPGIKIEDLQVELRLEGWEWCLFVDGERRRPDGSKTTLKKVVKLGSIDSTDKVKAFLVDGVLTVQFVRSDVSREGNGLEETPKRIDIATTESELQGKKSTQPAKTDNDDSAGMVETCGEDEDESFEHVASS